MLNDTLPISTKRLNSQWVVSGKITAESTLTSNLPPFRHFAPTDIRKIIAIHTDERVDFCISVLMLKNGLFVALRKVGKNDISSTLEDLILFGLTDPERKSLNLQRN